MYGLLGMTPERKNKFEEVLAQRQSDLTVVLEDVHDIHNISAVLRSCDSIGIGEIYIINSITPKPHRIGKRSSGSAKKWVNIHQFTNVADCMAIVKARYQNVLATHLNSESKELYSVDLTQPTALLFGNEQMGLSDEILQHATGNINIPQVGMVSSLNVSVACAVTLYEAYRQRSAKGMYEGTDISQPEKQELLKEWIDRDERRYA